jgi:prepilin-type N-terminal cleavage/methylation domain-containing protein
LYERRRRQAGARAGFTLVELVIVLAVIGAVTAIAASNLFGWFSNQRAATSARAVFDAFGLARAQAIRTGNNTIVAFKVETGLNNLNQDIIIANDGAPATANCALDSGETLQTVTLERGVQYGTTSTLSNGAAAPDDSGTSGRQSVGSSFANGSNPAGNASWVVFTGDGMPHRFTQDGTAPCDNVSVAGRGGGAIYLTNGKRDYAVVLSPLGTARLHRWNKTSGSWTQ